MDRNQLLNDPETAHRYAQDGLQSRMWTALPAVVTSVSLAKMTLECQPTVKGLVTNSDYSISYVDMPVLLDVPIVYPGAGGALFAFPIEAGDEVLVVFSSRCIDAWWQGGGVQIAPETRMHDLSDGFAIPGPRSQPNVAASISSDLAVIRSKIGLVKIGINKTSGKLVAQNAVSSLKSILSDTVQIESDLTTALTTFATGLNPGTLAAQAATLVTALGLVTAQIALLNTKIGAVLE